MGKQIFKKIIVACLFLSLAGTLTACQSKGKSENEVSQSSKVSDPTEISDKELKKMLVTISKNDDKSLNRNSVEFYYDKGRQGYVICLKSREEYTNIDFWYLVKNYKIKRIEIEGNEYIKNHTPFRVFDKDELEDI